MFDSHFIRVFGRLSLLSLALFDPAIFALTLPVLTNITADPKPPGTETLLTNAEVHCPPAGSTPSGFPFSEDCFTAISVLPRNDYIAVFHTGGDESLWRLPQTSSHQSCIVSVHLHEDIDSELGSWADVQRAAIQLLLCCAFPYEVGSPRRTGGWTTAGGENEIVIALRKSRYPAENGTEMETERGMTDLKMLETTSLARKCSS